ncbi:MAG: ATP-binding protein [Lachnospiraceae bacterium]|nr:ATP-binding protein [Lachnospiraceae bacterium]
MTYKKLSIEDILHEYEKIRLSNFNTTQNRKEEIYKLIPRIREIDEESSVSYIKAARMKLNNQSDTEVSSIKEKNRKLTAEKKELLKAHNYPENYLEPIYSCPVCKDTGYVNQERCKCFINKIIDGLYLQSNLQDIFKKENFDTFSLDYYSKEIYSTDRAYSPYENVKNILALSHKIIDKFDTDTGCANILIYGETGLGKTFLTNCIAKELLDRRHSVFYLSANELFEDVLAGYIMKNDYTYEDLYKFIYNCELLIIDDLGTELTNNFVLSELFEIINKRSINGKSTLISTNLSIKQLRDRYTERIMSRIVDNYTVFNIYGDNIRYQKRKQAINSQN